ncbi:MAG: hypothetical protein JHC57_08065 [Sphingopyxis sp.]|uniref:hypothetical protein n=1 Tax=Sphingopyxis sp. TaxID=1908224 RepID=UPI001A2B18C9|nr:hypothetical protein [Sphingopyxis sp.]MBJ7499692.1 hypothetical protein [Sphingopyxis sp.]
MTIFDHFDAIRIVNLAQRTDRRREMDRELARVGLAGDPRVAYFSAIRPVDAGRFTSIGAHGVYLSQKMLLREAAAAGRSLLILEDDCLFLPGAADREFGNDWDIFYGGYTASDPQELLKSDIQGAHMMGFSALGARLVSEYLEQLTCEGIHPPIDAAYVWFRRANPEVRTTFADPPLAGQRPSRSDIAALAWYDRVPLVRSAAALARALRTGPS